MIELFRDVDNQWRFRVKAKNGKIIAQSEGYTRKFNAYKAINALTKIFSSLYTIKEV